MDATQLLADVRLLPVVVIDDVNSAVPLARSLLAAGIGAIEITLRSEAALVGIELVAREVPEILVGAGSVRRAEQFQQIENAGASFAVSPGSTDALLAAANMPYVAGVATASESLKLLEAGYRLQKFFPAEVNGGIAALKAISAPIPEVLFCPTGGINATNARGYLALSCVACIGGSWFVPKEKLQQQDFVAIEELARQAVELTEA